MRNQRDDHGIAQRANAILLLNDGESCVQIAQIPRTMTAQAAIQPQARDIRAKELAHDSQEIVEQNEKRAVRSAPAT